METWGAMETEEEIVQDLGVGGSGMAEFEVLGV